MRKWLLFFILLLIAILVASWVAWANRANIAAHFLSRQLHVPVTLESLEISKTEADMVHLWIGNPPRSKTPTAFTAETISIHSTLDQMLGDPLIIDEIDISNIFVGVEYYDGQETNWSTILAPSNEKKGKDYLIRTLILTNLTVEVTQKDGTVKRYPTIPKMEFHDIGSETGFPVEEIEKAIFDLMMKDLFQRFNIENLIRQFQPSRYLLPNLP